MAGEQVQIEIVATPALSPPDFRTQVRDVTRPILCHAWYSPMHWRFVGFVRHHLGEVVELGGITSAPMQAALVEELGYQFSDPSDVPDALEEYDLRETEGKRPIIGIVGRFALLARFHYLDAQIMLRPLQMMFAPDKLAHAMGRTLIIDAYDRLDPDDQDRFEFYEGPIPRWQAFTWGLPQAALLGTPTVTAIRQRDSPVTLVWAGDDTRPNVTAFSARRSTAHITKLASREVRYARGAET